MPILNRRKVSTDIEKKVIIGMIVSKKYLQEIYQLADLSYFQSTYTRKIAEWCLEHYSYYEEAPFDTIQDIYSNNKPNLSQEDSELINTLLLDVSKKYEVEGINVPYLLDRTVEFFKSRELEITAGNIQVLLSKGDLASAEEQVANYRKVQKLASNWINPFDPDEIYETFQDKDFEFFKFPGVLGEFLGAMERGWLVGVSGAFKAGKTWFVQEFGVIALLSGLRVAFFSLEMNEKAMKERLYRRFTAAGDYEGEQIYPVFDCLKNQNGTCLLRRRVQDVQLLDESGNKPEFDKDHPYRVCTACRNLKEKNYPDREEDIWKENEADQGRREYQAETWFEILERPEFSAYETERAMKGFRKQFGHLYRIKAYPRFSANTGEIKRDLDLLEMVEGFIPDLIIIDYVDILKPEDSAISGIEKEDRSWIALARLAAERHTLVVTPTQVKIDALKTEVIDVTHMARWVGKLAHVDIMITLNQLEKEKPMGRARVGVIAHRHKEFMPGSTVTILQRPKLGQIHLDSERIFNHE
jgi:hypothetical protein